MNISEAQIIAKETHKGIHANLKYPEAFRAAQVLMLEALAKNGRQTDGALYHAAGFNCNG